MVGGIRSDDVTDPIRDLGALKQESMRVAMARLVVLRILFAPVFLTVMALTVWADPDPWRIAFGCALSGSVVTLFGVEYARWRAGWSGPGSLPPNIVAMLWIQLGVVVMTGGLEGPLFPILPMAALQLAIVFGPSPTLAAVVGAQLVAVWTMAALNATGTSLAVPGFGLVATGPTWPVALASFVTVMLAGAVFLGRKVRIVVYELVSDALGATDSERVAHAEHARELVALSGEIAHELKNPLASIKGLSALLARDLTGKSAERLAVLRAEVDRMQETLDQFLDFSRPLVPLTQTDVPVGELADEIVSLCEGVARLRGVTLVAEPTALTTRADRRKLRQVLVNLVQNAIEAAPAGTEVTIVARPDGPAIEVLDRGPGVDDAVRDVVFEAGVTTRPRGSGLGLTIARALVQQHGGRLALTPRDGGGTRATIVLGTPGPGPGLAPGRDIVSEAT
ncbi:MAG: HAMP domain-containing sensor histidine kinase [Myxococcota bacterium]